MPIRQNKTTLKPPFDLSPYTVTEVNGNRVLAQRCDGSTRIQDKNNLKKLKDRPANLIPTWEKNQPTLDFSIFYPYRGMDVKNSNQFLPWISLT